MFARLREKISKADIGSAWRFSRGIAGGMTGLFFFLGSITRAPLEKFLGGYGSSFTTLSVALAAMIYKSHQNLLLKFNAPKDKDDPDAAGKSYDEASLENSVGYIISELKKDERGVESFLEKLDVMKKIEKLDKLDNNSLYSNNKNEVKYENFLVNDDNDNNNLDNELLEDHININEENLDLTYFLQPGVNAEERYKILNLIYHAIRLDYTKWPVSFGLALFQVSAHFGECMLAQVYCDAEFMDFRKGVTADNILGGLLLLMSLYQGAKTFLAIKNDYENPSVNYMSPVVLKAYREHIWNNLDQRSIRAEPKPREMRPVRSMQPQRPATMKAPRQALTQISVQASNSNGVSLDYDFDNQDLETKLLQVVKTR